MPADEPNSESESEPNIWSKQTKFVIHMVQIVKFCCALYV